MSDPSSSRISAETVAKVARLARLDVTPDEVARLTSQLDGMLEHFADIDALAKAYLSADRASRVIVIPKPKPAE